MLKVWKLVQRALFEPLKQILPEIKIFFQICTPVEQVMRNTFSFVSMV
jgi:hypothetical protein